MNVLYRVGVATAIVIAAAGTVWRVHGSKDGSGAEHGAERAPIAPSSTTTRWVRGREYRYDARWETHGALAITQLGSGAPIEGRAQLEGGLIVRALGDDGRGELLDVSFDRIGVHALRIGAQDALADDATAQATFGGQHAYARLATRGAIAEVMYRPAAPALFRRMMDGLVLALGVTGPEGAVHGWSDEENGPSGRAHVTYEAEGERIARTRTRYVTLRDFPQGACDACAQSLRSRSVIALSNEGALAALDDVETLGVQAPNGDRLTSSSETHLLLTGVSSFAAEALDTSELTASAGGIAALDSSERRTLDTAAAGTMTPEELDGLVDRIARNGAPITERGWLSRAAGYLRIHPEAIAALRNRALAVGTKERDAALVLLAAAGTSDAQRAMQIVAARAVAVDPPADAARSIQRFTLVAHPDRASGEFLRDAYLGARRSTARDVAHGAAAALGAVAGSLARSGETAASRDLTRSLEGDLTHATSPDDKRALVLALGNVHDEAEAARILPLANDSNAAVRAEVAWSLRDASSDEAHATLLALLADAQPGVAALALRTLDRQKPDGALLAAVADGVVSGAVSNGIDGALVDFFSGHTDDRADAGRALTALLARAADPELRGRIRVLLAGLE